MVDGGKYGPKNRDSAAAKLRNVAFRFVDCELAAGGRDRRRRTGTKKSVEVLN